jgi:hypothetical protein
MPYAPELGLVAVVLQLLSRVHIGTSAAISLVAKPYEGRSWQAMSWLPEYWPQPAGTGGLVGVGAGRVGLGDGATGDRLGEPDGDADGEGEAEPDGDGEYSRSSSREARWLSRSAESAPVAAVAAGRRWPP